MMVFQRSKTGPRTLACYWTGAWSIRPTEIKSKLWNLIVCQNSKIVKTENFKDWVRRFVHPPILGIESLSNRLRASSKLFMEPWNVIAPNPQMWLLALLWCKKCMFWLFVFYCQITYIVIPWSFWYLFMVECHTFDALRVTYVSALLVSSKANIAILWHLLSKYWLKSILD